MVAAVVTVAGGCTQAVGCMSAAVGSMSVASQAAVESMPMEADAVLSVAAVVTSGMATGTATASARAGASPQMDIFGFADEVEPPGRTCLKNGDSAGQNIREMTRSCR
jgi:hypothetical protein